MLDYRQMSEADLTIVLRNERSSYIFPWTEGVFRDCLSGRYECWLAYANDAIVGHGVVSAAVGEGHLLNICIAKDWQGKGMGRLLLRFLIDRVIDMGADVMFLEVRASNHVAISMYEGEGFNLIGERPNYYPGKPHREDAKIMSLVLGLDDTLV